MTGKPCCSVGSRPDAGAIDAALYLIGHDGGESLSAIAVRVGVAKSSLHRHRVGCLGQGAPATPAGPDDAAGTVLERPADEPGTETERLGTPSGTTQARARMSHGLTTVANRTDEQRATDDRVSMIANLLHLAQWRDRATVVGLSERWGISHEAVERLHRVAAARVRASRGSPAAQLELSVATLKKIRDTELAYADETDAEAKALLADPKTARFAKFAKKVSAVARSTALAAQKQIDSLTIARPLAASIHVSVQTSPDFEKVWDVVARILDARYPGASSDVETGLAAWEDRGDAGLEEYLSGEGALLVTAEFTQVAT